MKTQRFKVTGMHCEGCAERVRTATGAIPGVTEASVDLRQGELWVRSEDGVNGAEVTATVQRLGFGVGEEGEEL